MPARISILGPGDIDFQSRLLGKSLDFFYKHLDALADELANGGYDLVCIPDKGMPFELIKRVVARTNRSAIGLAPLSDKELGTSYIQSYLNSSVNGTKVFNPVIDSISWYKTNFLITLMGDASLILGQSIGTALDIFAGLYMHRVFLRGKHNRRINPEDIFSDLRAGSNGPFTLILYEPFVFSDLPMELYKYAEDLGVRIVRIKSAGEIHKYLKIYQQSSQKI